MTHTFHRDRSTWLPYFLLAFYGYFVNILGPITPFLKDELALSYTVSSLHFTAFAMGILLAGVEGHILVQRLGRRHALWLGAFGMSAGVFLLLAGQTAALTIGACFAMGLVGSLILVTVPSTLSDQHGENRVVAFSEANLISSIASTAAPLLVGWFAPLPGGWRLALGVVALAPVFLRLAFGRAVLPPSPSRQEAPVSARRPLPFRFWVYWTALVLAVSAEFCMIYWSADYLENTLGLPRVDAAQAVGLFLAAMIVGRLAGSRLVRTFRARRVILASILVAAIGFLLYWTTHTALLGLVGLFVTGLGVAGLYPLLLSLAIGVASDDTVQASARTTLASGTAILSLPLALGRMADAVGIRPAYGIIGLLLLGIFSIMLLTGGRASGGPPG